MNIAFYNEKGIGDTLLVTMKKSAYAEQGFERVGDVSRLFLLNTEETIGYNFFNVSSYLQIKANGVVALSEESIQVLNEQLKKAGFSAYLTADSSPKFVVGYVKECVPHPDSDHLSITQIEVDQKEVLQIVCGASNIAQGQKVVVAKIGAVMPSGMIIWDGSLRGERSQGMVCSANELNLPHASTEKGILVLPDDAVVGAAFDTSLVHTL